MFNSSWRRCLLAMPVILSVVSSGFKASAVPAAVFIPHMEDIQRNLPVGLAMRLPDRIPLSDPSDIQEDKLVVRFFPSSNPQSFTVSLFTCARGIYPCLLGSFMVDRSTSVSAQRELQRHQDLGDYLTLDQNIKGYLIEGPEQNPYSAFSTLMWQQNGMIYSLSFPAIERQSMLQMAVSMARQRPFYRLGN
ncbi:MAG: hypothetical protein F6J96_35025 [Symploca sp. SIO1C2]|nr:hypothetical protein [Symploca sp. SIO1C2]